MIFLIKDVIVILKNYSTLNKMLLPNGRTIDIMHDALLEISKYTIGKEKKIEAGGLLLGYTHKQKKSSVIEEITSPQKKDIRRRTIFKRKDSMHMTILESKSKNGTGYMGTWHTHPQLIPYPSPQDIMDWNTCLQIENTPSGYIIFIIAAQNGIKVWAGDTNTKAITELKEIINEV